MLGWIKVLKKKFNKMSATKQFLIAAVIIVSVRYVLKTIIYTNFTFSYLENLENPTSAIYFHMNGCGHCKNFTPVWDSFVNNYKGPVKCKKMERAEAGDSLLKKYKVEGFPTVIKIDEAGNYETFNGERTKDGLKKFIG
tara:strand:- start:44 stop:460 length:417 start_codon:yes stop_codon:yes gene_type:complete